jgi:hypothetical protein
LLVLPLRADAREGVVARFAEPRFAAGLARAELVDLDLEVELALARRAALRGVVLLAPLVAPLVSICSSIISFIGSFG